MLDKYTLFKVATIDEITNMLNLTSMSVNLLKPALKYVRCKDIRVLVLTEMGLTDDSLTILSKYLMDKK